MDFSDQEDQEVDYKPLIKKVELGILEYSRADLSDLLHLPYIRLAPIISRMKFEGVLIPSPRKPSKFFLIDKVKLIEFSKNASKSRVSVEPINQPQPEFTRFLCLKCSDSLKIECDESPFVNMKCDNCKREGITVYGVIHS